MSGYTVVDLETTGLFPQKHDRVVEIGLVAVSDDGTVESEWSTLINPERDVGPTHIHGITARDVLDAPTFREVAAHLVAELAGRTLVAHNARFDTQFLDYEFERAGLQTRPPTPSLCTMQLSNSFLRGASRKLKDCCAAASVDHVAEHTALGDARAVAGLLRYYMSCCGMPVPWSAALEATRSHWWPECEKLVDAPCVCRNATAHRPDAWLDRISSQLPRNPEPKIEAYLDVLERAMIDGYLSAHEEQALIQVAVELGLHRDQVAAVHATFLDAMAIAAWSDGVVTDTEFGELVLVAGMLGLPSDLVHVSLDRVERLRLPAASSDGFRLRRGDQVVFTGDLSVPRDQLVALAQEAGLRHGGVNKSTRVVVAADPDSMSGKAAKARSYGIPVITEAAFARMMADLN
jgi:DNA polymerase-3 subunit epsilon